MQNMQCNAPNPPNGKSKVRCLIYLALSLPVVARRLFTLAVSPYNSSLFARTKTPQ